MITTHVLDTATGRPGRGIAVELERRETGGGDPDGSAGGAGGSAARGLERSETGGGDPDGSAGGAGGSAARGLERSETGGGDPDGSAGGAGGSAPRGIAHHDAGSWHRIGAGATDDDGRLRTLTPAGPVAPGVYRLRFHTGAYFATQQQIGFFPVVEIQFTIVDGAQHYHVPLLLSPYGYSTYRGS